MIDFIVKVWYDDEIIAKQKVYKSFRITGIERKLDHSEDYLCQPWSKIIKEKPLFEYDLEDSYEIANEDEILIRMKTNKNIHLII